MNLYIVAYEIKITKTKNWIFYSVALHNKMILFYWERFVFLNSIYSWSPISFSGCLFQVSFLIYTCLWLFRKLQHKYSKPLLNCFTFPFYVWGYSHQRMIYTTENERNDTLQANMQILQRVVYFVSVTEKPSIQFLSKIHLSQMKENTVKVFNISDICPGLNKKGR